MSEIYVFRLDTPMDWWVGWMNETEFQAKVRKIYYDPQPVIDQP